MQSGIYIIINNKTGRSYIGSTTNFKQRWQNHKTRLRRGAHDNPYLQHSWNKYGESAFEFKVLEYLNKPKEIYLAEQFWMDVYRLEGKELYNCGLVACSPMLGRSASDETKQKIGMVSAKAYPALINIKTGEKIPAHFIKEVKCEHNDKLVFTANWGVAVSKNPYLSFKFTGGAKGDSIKVSWVDNKGDTDSRSTKVK